MNKMNKHIQKLLFTAGFLLCSAQAVQAATYTGGLDTVSDTAISGWAKDLTSPDNPVSVSIVISPEGSQDTVREVAITASNYRSADDYTQKTSGYCGFNWNVDWSELENGTYQISMKAGSKVIRQTMTYTNTSGIEKAAPEEPVNSLSVAAKGARPLGTFKTTAYCPCYACSEGWGRSTSTGATARARHTIAVDPRIIPYGSKVLINGVVYTAEDRGGGVKGSHIDVFYDTHAETRQHGTSYAEVFLLP